jgi:hypothetical protein
MKIKVVVVDLEMSPRTRRLVIGIGSVLLLGIGAIAYASVPKTWVDPETLTSADLNGNFASLDGRLTAVESQERVRRATLGSDGTVTSQTGLWISLAAHSTGAYTVTFSSGTFSAVPTCVASAAAGNQVSPSIECYNISATGMECTASAASEATGAVAGPVDTGISLICVGPG